MQTQTFEEEIAIEHLARLNAEKWGRRLKEIRGEYIYTDFCVWLHCQGKSELRNNERAFAEWLKRENRTLTEYQRRWIAELCGVSVGYIRNVLSQAKVKVGRPKHNYKQSKLCENTQAIITALKSGKRVREICDEFGVSKQYIHEVKNKFVKEQRLK